MRHIILTDHNTEAWNGLTQDDKDVFAHTADDIVEQLSATGEWVGGEGPTDASQARSTRRIVDVATPGRAEEIAARWPDAQHWGIEIRALMHGGGEED